MKRKIVKSFNLEAAKNGAKVETRNGHKVEILRTDLKNSCPILGIVTGDYDDEGFSAWKTDGTTPFKIMGENDNDLVIVEYEDEDEESEDEKMKKSIKPFDLEAAKNGAKIETRNGMKVEIVRWNLNNSFPILGIVTGDNGYQSHVGWRINGTSPTSPLDSDYDLVIVGSEDEFDWKPTDEQIEAIRHARSFVVDDFGEHPTLSEILMELEEQLRKIKEEI